MEQEIQQGETKKCPKCGEEIQVSAKRCKHCQADLRNWFVRHKILTGILALIVIGIIASAVGGDNDKKQDSTTQNKPKAEVSEAVPNNQKEEKQKEEQPKKWVSVAKLSATENKQSDTFSLNGGKQKLIYTTTGANVNCYVYMLKDTETLDKDGGIPEVMIDKATSNETLIRKSKGDYYLDIKPILGKCSVEVMEER